MENTQVKHANPAPLGLLGCGMTAILLSLHNAGIFGASSVIAAMAFALGGLAQIIAGIVEFKHNNTFGATAFTAYGLFWWSLLLIWTNGYNAAWTGHDSLSFAFYLALWAIFTIAMFCGTLKHGLLSQIVFGSLAVTFILLSLHFFTGVAFILTAAGVMGIICGISAMYQALGTILNAEFGRKIFPLC